MPRVNLPTAVEVHFDERGRPRVRNFLWGGKRLPVTAVGRTWLDDAGRHLMVMAPGDRAFELLLRRSDLTWRVVSTPLQENLA